MTSSLGGNKLIPLKVVVTDRWEWPLLAIAVGVVGGYLTHFLADNWRPRRLNLYTMVRLRSEVLRRRELVRQPEKQEKLDAIAGRLRDAGQRNDLGQTVDARSQLDQAEQELDAFRKAEVTEKSQARSRRIALKTQVDDYRRRRQGRETPEEADFLKGADDQLASVEGFLAADEVDRAVEALGDIQGEFDGVRAQVLGRQLQELREVVGHTAGDGKDDLEKAIDAAEALVAAGKFDEAWRDRAAIGAAIDDLRTAGGRGARPSTRGGGGVLALPQAAAPEGPRIVATDPPQARTTDTPLGFTVEAPAGGLDAAGGFRWYFGDSRAVDTKGPRGSHRFAEEGSYWVKVQALSGGGEVVAELTDSVTVLPGRTQDRLNRLLGEVRAADVALVVVAIILACFTGILTLYVNKPFGSLTDYLGALLWGFGVDSSVRGFTAVFKKIGTSGTAS